MGFNAEELSLLEANIVERIVNNIRTYNRTGELENYLIRIECDDLITPYNTQFGSNAKIIVIGASMISQDEMCGIAKKMGIHPSHLELHLDYEKNKLSVIDYFTKTEFDENVDRIQDALNAARISFYLNSVQDESGDDSGSGYIHYEWVFEVT